MLLIGCMNVANLALVRARARAKEMATRLALGAPPWQLARQLVVENVLLTGVAAGAGLLVGAAALRAASAFDFQDLPYGSEIRLDATSALYALGLALAIGVVMGLVPLASALRTNPSAVLRQEGRSSTGGGGARALRRTLVVAQVAFTFVLLLGAGLLLASFARVLQVDPGFVAERVTTASVSLPRSRYADDDASAPLHGRGPAAGAGAAGRRERGRHRHDPLRRVPQRQRDHRRGLPDEAGRVGDLARPGGDHARLLRGDGRQARGRAILRGEGQGRLAARGDRRPEARNALLAGPGPDRPAPVLPHGHQRPAGRQREDRVPDRGRRGARRQAAGHHGGRAGRRRLLLPDGAARIAARHLRRQDRRPRRRHPGGAAEHDRDARPRAAAVRRAHDGGARRARAAQPSRTGAARARLRRAGAPARRPWASTGSSRTS